MSERSRIMKYYVLDRMVVDIERLVRETETRIEEHEEDVILDTYISMYRSILSVLQQISERQVDR